MKIHINNAARNIIVITLAALFAAICAYSLIVGAVWIDRPFAGFLILKNKRVSLIMRSHWEGPRRGVKSDDYIMAVDGREVKSTDEIYDIVAADGAGAPHTYRLLRAGKPVEITVEASLFRLNDYLVLFVGFMVVGAFLYGMGLMVFYLRPNLPVSRALLLLGIFVGATDASGGEFCTNHTLQLGVYLYPLLGPTVLLISLYFPEKLRSRKYFIIGMLATLAPFYFLNLYHYNDPLSYRTYSVIIRLYSFGARILGVIIMIRTSIVSKNPLTRQKGKVVIYGFALAFLLIIGIVIGWKYFDKEVVLWTLLPWLIVAFSVAYATLKQNIFDADIFIRRSVSYIIVAGVAAVLFTGLIMASSIALVDVSGRTSQAASIIATIIVVLMFRPLRRRIDSAIDRRFFREKYEYTATIRKASALLVSIIELDKLLERLLGTVMDAIKIERGVILLENRDDESYKVAAQEGYNGEKPRPMAIKNPLVDYMRVHRRALQKNELVSLHEFKERGEVLAETFGERQVVLLIPIIYERDLIGILGLGEKKSGAWYSSEDIELLQTLMMQTAVSIENARKVEELKKMVQLETSYRELKRLDEMKDNFLSMVSHDLRTPMTSIKGYATIMREKLGKLGPERQEKYLGIIVKESERLTRLINNLLDLQRFEAGRMSLQMENFDIMDMINEAVNSFRGAAMTKHIAIEWEQGDGQFTIKGDRDRLAQVIANLLSNAVKFTPDGGTVSVKAEKAGENDDTRVRVSVSDTGAGIPKDKQAALFDKFQQVEGATRDRQEGSGLGLALVKEIVEAHGGRVGMKSEPGKGSVFYFVL